jgi:hypothetical protein
MPGFPTQTIGTPTNRGKARRYKCPDGKQIPRGARRGGGHFCAGRPLAGAKGRRNRPAPFGVTVRVGGVYVGAPDLVGTCSAPTPLRTQDAGLPDTNHRDPHKPGESPALQGAQNGEVNSPLQRQETIRKGDRGIRAFGVSSRASRGRPGDPSCPGDGEFLCWRELRRGGRKGRCFPTGRCPW